MLNFEVINELTLKVTCTGRDVLYTKAGAFIAGSCPGQKNYTFERLILGPEGNLAQAALGNLMRRATKEHIPLMKANLMGDSVTYYASYGRHIVLYKLGAGEIVSVESENLLAFTDDCQYGVRFIGTGVISQRGLATTTLTGRGPNAYVAILSNGNPLVLSNVQSNETLSVDPDAVICWMSYDGYCDPQVKTDLSWKNLIGMHSGESYTYEWHANQRVFVVIQPSERAGGIQLSLD